MHTLEKARRWVQAVLTWLFVRLLKRSKLEGTEELTLLDDPVTVYTFRKDSDIYAQATPFGTIIWNKTRTEELSTDGKRFVLHHELSHKNRNSIYKGLLYGMAVSGAGGIVILFYSGIFFFLGSSLAELAEPATTGLVMTVAFATLFRIEETWADYDAICELGEEKFRSAYDEIGGDHEPAIRSRIFRRLFYTHPDQTVQLYQHLHQR
jgi:Zn-dependent protease with chaperone function